MRPSIAIATSLILAVNTLVIGADAPKLKPEQDSPPMLTPPIDSHASGTEAVHRHECSKCASRLTHTCYKPCCVNRTLILRRYYWIPASYAGIHTRVVATGYAVSGVSGTNAPVTRSSRQYVTYPGLQSMTGTIGTNSTGVIATGPMAIQSGGIGALPVLPKSPYQVHSSYAAYSEPPSSRSYGTYPHTGGLINAGFSGVSVYPTAQFRGTYGFVAPVAMPYYAGY